MSPVVVVAIPNLEGHNFPHRPGLPFPLMLFKVWKSTTEEVVLQPVRSILNDSASPLTTNRIYEAAPHETRTKYPHPPMLIQGTSAERPKE